MTPSIKPLTPDFGVCAQASPADMAAFAALGYKTVVNNRPDGEGGPQQPLSADVERAARAAGLYYVYLPVVSGAITAEQAQAMARVLREVPQPVLAFCRSGARSAHLYALALG